MGKEVSELNCEQYEAKGMIANTAYATGSRINISRHQNEAEAAKQL